MAPPWWSRVRGVAVQPPAPPPVGEHRDRVLYGLRAPLVGIALLARHPALLRAAVYPAGLLAAACALFAFVSPGGHGFVRRFYELFAWLAPLPSVILAPHYARLAVLARDRLGLGVSSPCIEGFWKAVWRAIAQAILIGIGLAPLGVLDVIPVVGRLLLKGAALLWALLWIVVDAFDSTRVLEPGETLEMREAAIDTQPSPWFVRAVRQILPRVPRGFRHVLSAFVRFIDWLARPWRDEMMLVEQHPTVVVGFALTTALLLATPALNLLFRPIVLVAAIHTLELLRSAETPALPA